MAASRRSNRQSPDDAKNRRDAVTSRSARRGDRDRALYIAAIVDQSNDAIVSFAPEGTITSWSPGAERLYGFAAAEVLGRHPDDLSPTPGEFDRLLRLVANGEPVVNREAVHFKKDGERLAVSLTLSAIQDANGAIVGFSGIARDITVSRRTEERLRRQNGYLAALHETTLALMNRHDLAGLLETIITRAAALLNVPHGYIYRVDAAAHELVAIAGVGMFGDHLGRRLPYGVGLGGRVWQSGKALAIQNYSTW